MSALKWVGIIGTVVGIGLGAFGLSEYKDSFCGCPEVEKCE